MQQFDNINKRLIDNLKVEIKKNSRVSIAAACFSIYAYQELRKELSSIKELRFIFTSPTFVGDKQDKEKREFYIPRVEREKSLYGTEFEIRLRNQLNQKAISKECADWIRQKVKFKSNVTNGSIQNFINLGSDYTYTPINGFTTTDLGTEKGDSIFTIINKLDTDLSKRYLNSFDEIWNDENKVIDVKEKVLENIETLYNENSPEFVYILTIYNIFHEFLDDIDDVPNVATGFKDTQIWNKLYTFQKDAVLAIIHKLEKYNGCILADSVGLGKTFTALAVIKYYENRNKNVLVLCPKKLQDNWITFKSNYLNNPIAKDRLRYDVLYHTDLSRINGNSGDIDLSRINWGNYDFVVIDESHNFRNGGLTTEDDEGIEHYNRYENLMNKVIKAGVKTKVLMLSATPVNNRFVDLKNQLELAYEGVEDIINEKLNTKKSISAIFNNAQRAFNEWGKMNASERTSEKLLSMLDLDFFEVLDSVTIARSRKSIEKNYNMKEIGNFPKRLLPVNESPSLTTNPNVKITYKEIFNKLDSLNLDVYSPSKYIFPTKLAKYEDLYGKKQTKGITLKGREDGMRKLMAVNLLKRLESSINSFRQTATKVLDRIDKAIEVIENYTNRSSYIEEELDFSDDDLSDVLSAGGKYKIDMKDIDHLGWLAALKEDSNVLKELLESIAGITPEYDNKLQTLISLIGKKIKNPINDDNKKILIFTAFADTAEYLYENLEKGVLNKYGLHTAMITGSNDGKSNVPGLTADFNNVLTLFSPISKDRDKLNNIPKGDIDILIATDCISEGQNLQDCDYVINFDIHWNPVRLIQRFGRIDRIGSHNKNIQMVNFWPDIKLDEYINLKSRVENRMVAGAIAGVGENIIGSDIDLGYRGAQLVKIQTETPDIEDMKSGVNIMDLGLNEYRTDLLNYVKDHKDIENSPHGMNAIVPSTDELKPGVIYILKNVNNGEKIDEQNRIHPFYMVYIANDGVVVFNHLEPKKLLDSVRLLCKGVNTPYKNLCKEFNKETKDGFDMSHYSDLLSKSIQSIINVKEESEVDSLFSDGSTSFLTNKINGLADFELICFLVVK